MEINRQLKFSGEREEGTEMEQLIKGKAVNGKYYVRPISWEGQWDKDGNLTYGNTLFESESESDCDIYIKEKSIDEKMFDFSGIYQCITSNEELKRLISENPDLPIMYMCGEECYSDDYGYTINTGSYNIEEVTLVDDMICDDKVELEEKVYWKLERRYPEASEELLNILTKEKLEKFIWKKAITVRLG